MTFKLSVRFPILKGQIGPWIGFNVGSLEPNFLVFWYQTTYKLELPDSRKCDEETTSQAECLNQSYLWSLGGPTRLFEPIND